MRFAIAVMGVMCAASGSAVAAEDPADGFYGNTVELRTPTRRSLVYINKDGSWDAIYTDRFANGDRWEIQGEQICFYAPDEPEPGCFDGMRDRNPGDHWTVMEDGTSWAARLYEGRDLPRTLDPTIEADCKPDDRPD